jgi:hypothetical protein
LAYTQQSLVCKCSLQLSHGAAAVAAMVQVLLAVGWCSSRCEQCLMCCCVLTAVFTSSVSLLSTREMPKSPNLAIAPAGKREGQHTQMFG